MHGRSIGNVLCASYSAPAPSLKKTMIVSNFVANKVDRAYVSEGPAPRRSVTERRNGNYDSSKGPPQTCRYVPYQHGVCMQDTCI